MLDSGEVSVVDGAVEGSTGVTREVYLVAHVVIVGFNVHVMFIQEVVDHCDGFLGVLTLGCPMKCHAAVRVCTTGDEVVEQLYVAVRSDEIEDLQ